ncbi:pyruvate kinase [Afipia felis]|uniref:pyruvate kinase n=1 Tax=Afipia felis ATCC 53690 TaxID=883080 RepID=A0ABN0I760_AFIFE|nr:pyruvate kinase [Afipia felis]EKS28650.1 hypothetical protein HMPREF9697_01178 [Afipia felis ATCC 53690]
MSRNRRAKIVATLGPASSSPEMIRKLYDAGVDMFRLNFSHGTHEDHRARYEAIRAVEREVGTPIAILQDLQGPKIRLGPLEGGKRELTNGSTVRFVCEKTAKGNDLPLPHKEVFDAIVPGNQLLIDDGKVRLSATGVGEGYIDARVIAGGIVSDRKGVNLPDTILALSPITEKDRVDLAFGLELKNITHVGANGDGQTTKVANQIIVALNIEAVAEALIFASKAGADPAKVRQALMGGFASSRILEVHGERMIKRTFDPGFRIELHQKDLNLALQGAKALGVALPNTAMAQELFNTCAANGGKAWDHSGMVKALELMANHAVAGKK